MIDLAYRTGQIQMIQAQAVRESDYFEYQYGLEPKLVHRPGDGARGEVTFIYGMFRLTNGGYGFEVSNKADMDAFAEKYSKSYGSRYSPWTENYEDMAKKTVIKRALKYAPISSELQKALSSDETIKTVLSVDMSEINNECQIDEVIQEDAA